MLLSIIKLIARFAVSFIAASLAVFLIMRLLPGDPAQIALGINATPELLAKTRAEFGTDRPLLIQYIEWIGGILRGDFGNSYITRQDISPVIADRTQVSLILVAAAMVLSLLIAVPAGILAALKNNRPIGTVISVISQLGIAVPGFLAAILLVLVFAVQLKILPANGWTVPAADPVEFLRKLILPTVSLAAIQGAIMTRYIRTAVLEVLGEEYLTTARAKGLTSMQALSRHGLRGAAIPIITVTGVQVSAMLVGAVVIERVFVIPGLGSLLVESTANRDLLTVQAIVMVLVGFTLAINLVIELVYTLVDPRLRRRGVR